MNFEQLYESLVCHVSSRVRNGELTVRGLARRSGISQPHLHNILKGKRFLSPQSADLLLRHLDLTVFDLLRIAEEERERRR
jgi:transcriptional regulator with XRE-family HTH domain